MRLKPVTNAARASKTKLDVIWNQVEHDSLLMVAGEMSGLDSNLLLTFAHDDLKQALPKIINFPNRCLELELQK